MNTTKILMKLSRRVWRQQKLLEKYRADFKTYRKLLADNPDKRTISDIIKENDRLKQQLALAMYDNERMMFELDYYQKIHRNFTV